MEESFAAIILMAGEGRRLGHPVPKQFLPLGSKKVYQHTLETFLDSRLFQQIVLVCHPDWTEAVKNEVPALITVVPGGPTRQASSLLGLQACDPGTHFVVIHDAVRPFVSKEILERNIAAVRESKAVDTCIPTADTIVHAKESKFITSIPVRKEYWRGQTPQTFDYKLICEAHRKTQVLESTDDCSLVLQLGHRVAIVAGSEENMKITTELDVELAQRLYDRKNAGII
jgi:ribitol-5-phosphate 2-dehydrogenase (NADP+) / D-ribitol-5-phosphate cytidylyltransferase